MFTQNSSFCILRNSWLISGGDEIGDLQMILLNKQQLVCGANDFIFQLPFNRYNYCEHNEVTFLWKELSDLEITLDIQGA